MQPAQLFGTDHQGHGHQQLQPPPGLPAPPAGGGEVAALAASVQALTKVVTQQVAAADRQMSAITQLSADAATSAAAVAAAPTPGAIAGPGTRASPGPGRLAVPAVGAAAAAARGYPASHASGTHACSTGGTGSTSSCDSARIRLPRRKGGATAPGGAPNPGKEGSVKNRTGRKNSVVQRDTSSAGNQQSLPANKRGRDGIDDLLAVGRFAYQPLCDGSHWRALFFDQQVDESGKTHVCLFYSYGPNPAEGVRGHKELMVATKA
ncbi:hypothetical protein CYMTET_23087 [Cymbomonas tetramitiformis]|uniref:Uncharacterized protein n=1 Tax=Cymbomonas tetramitiformis TaxID=36881 RepID=A0AAE0FZE6_9CHLO|nr:hypothetical protein CYMTET_23087 [Cymbomonas tetramitiformis]